MDIRISAQNVHTLAKRLRASVNTDSFSLARAFESLAALAGTRNWDTLSAHLKQESAPGLVLETPVVLYVGAFSTSEFGDSPNWARVTLTSEFLQELQRLSQLCTAQRLSHLAVSDCPDMWHENPQDPLRIQMEDLYVDQSSWWFRGVPKHCDYAVETRLIDIADLVRALQDKHSTEYLTWHKDILLFSSYGNTAGMLAELVDEGELDESYLPE